MSGERPLVQKEWVASRVAPSTRRADLTWDHHAAVAPLTGASLQAAWLKRAAERKWTPATLRAEIGKAMERLLDPPEEPPMPDHPTNCRCMP